MTLMRTTRMTVNVTVDLLKFLNMFNSHVEDNMLMSLKRSDTKKENAKLFLLFCYLYLCKNLHSLRGFEVSHMPENVSFAKILHYTRFQFEVVARSPNMKEEKF